MIGIAGQADADAKIKLPIRGNIKVDGRKSLVLLFALRIKTAQNHKPGFRNCPERGPERRQNKVTQNLGLAGT